MATDSTDRGWPRLGAALILFLVGLVAGAVPARAETVTIGGTGSAVQALRLLGARFMAEHPDTVIEVPSSLGSSGGIRAVSGGAIDLAVSARPLTDAERAAGLLAEPWGRTLLLVVVGPGVAERQTTFAGLADILAGRRPRWPDGEMIVPVLRPPFDADTLQLAAADPALGAALAEARQRGGMLVAITDQDAATMLSTVPGTIGLITELQKQSENLAVTALELEGHAPGPDALAKGYPMVRSYWLVRGPSPKPEARAFFEYLRGAAAASVVRGLGLGLAEGR
jgi:phosphate transport system substrate-binding protein